MFCYHIRSRKLRDRPYLLLSARHLFDVFTRIHSLFCKAALGHLLAGHASSELVWKQKCMNCCCCFALQAGRPVIDRAAADAAGFTAAVSSLWSVSWCSGCGSGSCCWQWLVPRPGSVSGRWRSLPSSWLLRGSVTAAGFADVNEDAERQHCKLARPGQVWLHSYTLELSRFLYRTVTVI